MTKRPVDRMPVACTRVFSPKVQVDYEGSRRKLHDAAGGSHPLENADSAASEVCP
jgi:hypothetical protein